MIISRKNFSEYEDERLYSVLMDEDELRLYSEFLEKREFAKNGGKITGEVIIRNGNVEKKLSC